MDGMIIGEFGACIPALTVGSAVAMYFGCSQHAHFALRLKSVFRQFVTMPMFFAVVLGLAASLIGMPMQNPVVSLAYKILEIIGGSLEVFVGIGIGLMLEPVPIRQLLAWIVGVSSIKLIAEPVFAVLGGQLFHLPMLEDEILLIEAAMPSGAIAAVLAARYGCDGRIGSLLTLGTYAVSLVTMPLIFWVFMVLKQ